MGRDRDAWSRGDWLRRLPLDHTRGPEPVEGQQCLSPCRKRRSQQGRAVQDAR
jgi:hypothetical protein